MIVVCCAAALFAHSFYTLLAHIRSAQLINQQSINCFSTKGAFIIKLTLDFSLKAISFIDIKLCELAVTFSFILIKYFRLFSRMLNEADRRQVIFIATNYLTKYIWENYDKTSNSSWSTFNYESKFQKYICFDFLFLTNQLDWEIKLH